MLRFALAGSNAGTIPDNFASYARGTLPSPTWVDFGVPFADPRTPIPSATVIASTDALNHPVQARQIANAVSHSRGIYARFPVGPYYTLAADIRVEQYSNHPQFNVSDWAMQLTCAQAGTGNFAYIPQAGIYAAP